MKIVADNIGKKFHPKWIFKNLGFTIDYGQSLVITGKNGSGKSTLLKIIAAYITPTAGKISWWIDNKVIEPDKVYHHLSVASPYLELIEDLSMYEMINFHGKFKAYREGLSADDLIVLSGLEASRDKPIRQFSSGMKQRLKLLLAICSISELLLLDEPCSNLDADSIHWYHQILSQASQNRTIIIASNNRPEEYPGYRNMIAL